MIRVVTGKRKQSSLFYLIFLMPANYLFNGVIVMALKKAQ